MGRSLIETPWMQYVRAVGIGSGVESAYARLVLQVQGRSPCMTLRRAEASMKRQRIDASTYRQIAGAVERLRDMWRRGIQTHVAHVEDAGVWESLGENRHRKRTYL